MRCRGLDIGRNREVLLHVALPAVHRGLKAVRAIDPVLQRAAELVLEDALSRVERERVRPCLPRVLLELRSRKAKRILRLRLSQDIADERKRSVAVRAEAHLAVEVVAVRFAVRAVAFSMEVRSVDDTV